MSVLIYPRFLKQRGLLSHDDLFPGRLELRVQLFGARGRFGARSLQEPLLISNLLLQVGAAFGKLYHREATEILKLVVQPITFVSKRGELCEQRLRKAA